MDETPYPTQQKGSIMTNRKQTPGTISPLSHRWLAQNRAYGDSWVRYAHPGKRNR